MSSACWCGGGAACRRWCRRRRGRGGTGGPVRRRRAAGRGRSRPARRRRRRRGRRVRAWSSTRRSPRPGRRPRRGAARARGGRRSSGSPACCGVILARREIEELADLGTVVHALDATAVPARGGMPCRYTSRSETPIAARTRVGWSHEPCGMIRAGSTDRPLTVEEIRRCVVLSCTPPATSGSRTGAEPQILKPTDAIIRLSATCICGSDLWPYRGIEALDGPPPMGHEYAGIVEEVGVGGHHGQAGPVRRRVVLRLRQHLRDLPGRLPALLPPP